MTYLRYSFAVDGDRVAIDDSTQPTGVVSLQSGYPSPYSLIPTNPLAKKIERNKFNQLMYLVTDAIRQYQTFGTPSWIPASENGGTDIEYAKDARVSWANQIYVSLENNNTDEPPSDKWRLDGFDLFYPVGIAVEFATNIDPNDLWPWSTWVRYAEGRATFGYKSGDPDFGTLGQTGGKKGHKMTLNNLIAHYHNINLPSAGTGGEYGGFANDGYNDGHSDYTTESAGFADPEPIPTLPPYVVSAKWYRTA